MTQFAAPQCVLCDDRPIVMAAAARQPFIHDARNRRQDCEGYPTAFSFFQAGPELHTRSIEPPLRHRHG